jgi:hypothetical protein
MAIDVKFKSLDEEEKKKIKEISQISLWLDNYTDIFSDFDPRPFSQRALSFDFLDEIQRATKEKKSGQIDLNLLIPSKLQNLSQENIIRKGLHEHFRKNYNNHSKEMKNILIYGSIMTAIGIFFMFSATYIAFTHKGATMFMAFLIVLLEPAGWFFFWEGLNTAIFRPKNLKQQLEFYSKMSKSSIVFMKY